MLELFKRVFPGNKNPEAWATALETTLPKYGITGKLRLAMFLAQCGHESQGFTVTRENLNYSADALAATWPKRYAVDPAAKVKAPNELAQRLARKPEAIANNVYAGRLGNGDEASGDGWLCRGIGPLQATGRGHIADFANRMGLSFEAGLEYMGTPQGGAEFACMFWKDNGLNALADAGDVLGATRRINGGTIGLADRKAQYTRIMGLLA